MSKEHLKQFCQLVLNDLEIQKHLKDLTDRDEFILKALELGTNLGLEITFNDIEEQMRENRRQWHERWM